MKFIFIIISMLHLGTTDGDYCDKFTISVNDHDAFNDVLPKDNEITSYVNASGDAMKSCNFLRVYIELDEPTCGEESQKINFTLPLENVASQGAIVGEGGAGVNAGAIAGAVVGTAAVGAVGYFGYNALMNLLKSGVYRFPPGANEMTQFKAL